MLSAYSMAQMEKALQQPPVMAALTDAQDRVRSSACDLCIAAFLVGKGCNVQDIVSWVRILSDGDMMLHPRCCLNMCAKAMIA